MKISLGYAISPSVLAHYSEIVSSSSTEDTTNQCILMIQCYDYIVTQTNSLAQEKTKYTEITVHQAKKKKIFTHLVSFVLLDEKNAIVYLKAFDNKQCSHKARVMLEVLNVLSLQMRERLFCIITE